MKRFAAIAALSLICLLPASADEGMWMVGSMSEKLVKAMKAKGLELDARTIYEADSDSSLSSAIVSLDFIGTGSMVSADGLLITNHHCAYSDVYALSTPEHNYLEDGFWAQGRDEEIRIPGKTVQILRRIVDVTDEVRAIKDEANSEGKPMGMRKLSHILESKWEKETGLMASLGSMWAGEKYYMSLYEEFDDVRLVAAPPVSIAAFGGDIDNWEWPQHKGDFALYRVYRDGKPYTPHAWLPISTEGYKPGSYTMVIGFPGRTDRYSSSAKVNFLTSVVLPITNKVRGDQMEIIRRWMDADPAVRLKYSDKFFSLSNVQELQEGEVQCCKRFGVVRQKQRTERRLRMSSGDILDSLDLKYSAIGSAERNLVWYRETLVRGSAIALIATRLKNSKRPLDMRKEYSGLDLRLEKDLFRYDMEQFYRNVDSTAWGPYQKSVYDSLSGNFEAIFDYLWTSDTLTKEAPLFRFFTDLTMADFNAKLSEIQGEKTVLDFGRDYTHALYEWRDAKGVAQYPDANSSLRITYGTVGTFRRGGKKLPWQTFTDQILSKENDSYEFSLKPYWKEALQSLDEQIPVDFITDNDITGGNSGSPVLNAKGEVIGLAFDGNKESLAGNYSWTEGFNKCVCVDIRYVLWVISQHSPSLYSELR